MKKVNENILPHLSPYS